VAWVFNNTTGLITLCTTTAAATAGLIYDVIAPGANNVVCTADKAVLVSGFLRYALGAGAAFGRRGRCAAFGAHRCAGLQPGGGLGQSRHGRAMRRPMQCVTEHVNPAPGVSDYFTAYYCAVPVTVIPGVTPHWTGSLSLGPAASMAPALATVVTTKLKACRYHTAASYALQSAPLTNQNFLLMRAGDGAAAFACPNPTAAHQPNA
jgi:hypothetical protein